MATPYLACLASVLPPDAFITSYVDDTYVCLSDKDPNELAEQLERTMDIHDDFLTSIGMVTNVEKMELIYFNRRRQEGRSLSVKNKVIKPSGHIKVLGVTFEAGLKWDHHIRVVIAKSRHLLQKLKFLKKFLPSDAMKKVATLHLFGLLYHAAPIRAKLTNHIETLQTPQIFAILCDEDSIGGIFQTKFQKIAYKRIRQARAHSSYGESTMANRHMANWLIWRIDYGKLAYGKEAYGETTYFKCKLSVSIATNTNKKL